MSPLCKGNSSTRGNVCKADKRVAVPAKGGCLAIAIQEGLSSLMK